MEVLPVYKEQVCLTLLIYGSLTIRRRDLVPENRTLRQRERERQSVLMRMMRQGHLPFAGDGTEEDSTKLTFTTALGTTIIRSRSWT